MSDLRAAAGVEVVPNGESGDLGTGGLLLGDRPPWGECRGDAVLLVGVLGEGGKRAEVGELAEAWETCRNRGRYEGGCRALAVAAMVFGLSSATSSGSGSGKILRSKAKLSLPLSASMMTGWPASDQSRADIDGESDARIASSTSRLSCLGETSSIETSPSKSDVRAVDELSYSFCCVIGCRKAGFRIVGEGVRESGDELEALRDRGMWTLSRDTPELSASIMVDSSWDSGMPGDGVRSVGAERMSMSRHAVIQWLERTSVRGTRI